MPGSVLGAGTRMVKGTDQVPTLPKLRVPWVEEDKQDRCSECYERTKQGEGTNAECGENSQCKGPVAGACLQMFEEHRVAFTERARR